MAEREKKTGQPTAGDSNQTSASASAVTNVWLTRLLSDIGTVDQWGEVDAVEVQLQKGAENGVDEHLEEILGPRSQHLLINDSNATPEHVIAHLAQTLPLPVAPRTNQDLQAKAVLARLKVMEQSERYLCLIIDAQIVPVGLIGPLVTLTALPSVKALVLNSQGTPIQGLSEVRTKQVRMGNVLKGDVPELNAQARKLEVIADPPIQTKPTANQSEIVAGEDAEEDLLEAAPPRSATTRIKLWGAGSLVIVLVAVLGGYFWFQTSEEAGTENVASTIVQKSQPVIQPSELMSSKAEESVVSVNSEQQQENERDLDATRSNSMLATDALGDEVRVENPEPEKVVVEEIKIEEEQGSAETQQVAATLEYRYTLQLIVFSKPELRDRFMSRSEDPALRSVADIQGEQSRYYMLYGRYEGYSDAERALEILPSVFSDVSPVVVPLSKFD